MTTRLIADKYRFAIPPDDVSKIRDWFKSRGGCLVWVDQEITGSPAPDQLTPATHADGTAMAPPHWKYGKPTPINPEEICVRAEQIITPPAEWFPKCTYCADNPGRRSVADIASARGISVEECRKSLIADNSSDTARLRLDLRDDNTVACWACDGTGHINRHYLIRLYKHWTGGRYPKDDWAIKYRKLAKKLGDDVLVTWQGYDGVKAEVVFYKEQITPFTLE